MGFITVQTENSALALFLNYLFNLLLQGWCLLGNSLWLYFIFLFSVLHSIPHKSFIAHSNCFIHLNGQMCVCVRARTRVHVCVCARACVQIQMDWFMCLFTFIYQLMYCFWLQSFTKLKCTLLYMMFEYFLVTYTFPHPCHWHVWFGITVYTLQPNDRGMGCKV